MRLPITYQGMHCLLFSAGARPKRAAHSTGRGTDGHAGDSADRLDVGGLEECAALYFAKGLAHSSHKTYRVGENRFLHFCQLSKVTPLPVSEECLCKFVSFLVGEGLKQRSIKTYLSGICYV